MDLARLVESLSAVAAYPYQVRAVEVRQTHISVVFLAGPYAYKVKKPVRFGFLDFSTLQARRHFCEEEVRLNRRLAPHVYLGVVPVARVGSALQFEGAGDAIEWAVKMKRLPESATLKDRLGRNEVSSELAEMLAQRIASFHLEAESNERIAAFGRFEAVAREIGKIFSQSQSHIGTTVSRAVFSRVKSLTSKALRELRPLIEARAARGVPRDCHGDLHLDHVYYLPDQTPPGDLTIIDCIEFNERLRCSDPVADMAFSAMDFAFYGRSDLSRRFAEAYFRATGDDEGRSLLPLYSAYRAIVRGMVEGMELAEKEVSAAERAVALERARAHWLFALTELDAPGRKPCLVLVTGLPGTGKSVLAQGLAASAAFTVIRSDLVRKELAGLACQEKRPIELKMSLYNREWTERTYAECLRRAEQLLFEGQRVIVDATFREQSIRQSFLRAAKRLAVPAVILVCHAEPRTVQDRLEKRQGDPSDADWTVYLQLAPQWEDAKPLVGQVVYTISTEGSAQEALALAMEALKRSAFFG